MAMAIAGMAMDTMAREKPRLLLLLSLAMATTARGRLRQLLWLLLSQLLLPSLAMDMDMVDMATVATEAMATVDMVTMAIMARGPPMLMPTTATEDMEDMEDMVMDTAMDMATTARDQRMLTTATVMAMVMAMVMATVMAMATATTDKMEGVLMMSR